MSHSQVAPLSNLPGVRLPSAPAVQPGARPAVQAPASPDLSALLKQQQADIERRERELAEQEEKSRLEAAERQLVQDLQNRDAVAYQYSNAAVERASHLETIDDVKAHIFETVRYLLNERDIYWKNTLDETVRRGEEERRNSAAKVFPRHLVQTYKLPEEAEEYLSKLKDPKLMESTAYIWANFVGQGGVADIEDQAAKDLAQSLSDSGVFDGKVSGAAGSGGEEAEPKSDRAEELRPWLKEALGF